MELIADILPPKVVNIVKGSGATLGRTLVEHDDNGKVAFTGSTASGRESMQYAFKHIIATTMELGGKSPNVFFDDVARANDALHIRAIESSTMFPLNKGEICSCPSRALPQNGPVDPGSLEDAVQRVWKITVRGPLDTRTEMRPQNSQEQLDKISAS